MLHISSRTRTKAEKLAEFVKQTYHVSTKVFDEADQAMENADIVATATNSNKPVFSHSLHPGVHLNAVGSFKPEMQELPSETMLIANKIVVESTEAAMEETGDLKVPLEEGIITEQSLHGELGDIVSGKISGRDDEEEVTVFKSVGLAIVDIVVAQYFYKKLNKLINHILYKNRYRISDNVAMADTVFYCIKKINKSDTKYFFIFASF